MKLHCILALVNVLAISKADYLETVFITNKYIIQAFNYDKAGLKTVIKNLVSGNTTMDKISLMLAVPEHLRVYEIGNYLRDIYAITDQHILQNEIHRVTNLPVPEIDSEEVISDYTLPYLGNARRTITKEVTKSLVFNAISRFEPRFSNIFTNMCRLIGLLRSIAFPSSFITFAEVDSFDTCTLTSKNDRSVSRYRIINDIIVEVQVDNIEEIEGFLSAQLNIW